MIIFDITSNEILHNMFPKFPLRENLWMLEKIMLELIDELILLVTHLKYYDGPNCDLIKYKNLLVIIMGSDNKIK